MTMKHFSQLQQVWAVIVRQPGAPVDLLRYTNGTVQRFETRDDAALCAARLQAANPGVVCDVADAMIDTAMPVAGGHGIPA
jgi:hypothetical protein